MRFNEWCESVDQEINGHQLKSLAGLKAHLKTGCSAVALKIPAHYASEERLAGILERLGKPESAQYLRDKLPETSRIRSGDLGEILAVEYIAKHTPFAVPVKRLRWKDHREMAMRGDDLIGIQTAKNGKLKLLKGESKSRAKMGKGTILAARKALDKNNGLPSPHALTFIADRIREQGNATLANTIDDAQLTQGIKPNQVEHCLFVFSGNGNQALLAQDLKDYQKKIPQYHVGLQITDHQQFIRDVYEKVIANGNDS